MSLKWTKLFRFRQRHRPMQNHCPQLLLRRRHRQNHDNLMRLMLYRLRFLDLM
jgi:hypothetical protein